LKGKQYSKQRLEIGFAMASAWLEQYNIANHGDEAEALHQLYSAMHNGRKPTKPASGCSERHLLTLIRSAPKSAVNDAL
jgi:hypothetical protein